MVVVEVHVVWFVEGAIHDGERMEREWTKTTSGRIDELDWATSAKTEACNVGITHSEIVGDVGIDKRFHIGRLQRAEVVMTSKVDVLLRNGIL